MSRQNSAPHVAPVTELPTENHDAVDADQAGSQPGPGVTAAEQLVCATSMESADAAGRLAEIVGPGDMFNPRHAAIYAAAQDLAGSGEPVTVQAVTHLLDAAGDLDRAGGVGYLLSLIEKVTVSDWAVKAARQVAADAQRRQVYARAIKIREMATAAGWDPTSDPEAVSKELEQALATNATLQGAAALDMPEAFTELIDRIESTDSVGGLRTGWPDIDALGHMKPGNLVIIGARTNVGKTTLVCSLAVHTAMQLGERVMFFSVEMERHEVMSKIVASQAKVDSKKLDKDPPEPLSEHEWRKVAGAQERVTSAPIRLEYAPGLTLETVRQRLRWLKVRGELPRLVVVDYLQVMTSPSAESRQLEVSRLSMGLKQIAGEFGVVMVAPAQLNRGPEHRPDSRPNLADLRESGSLENDASIVFLLHKPDPEGQPMDLDVEVAKNRNGARSAGPVRMRVREKYSQVLSATRREHEQGTL